MVTWFLLRKELTRKKLKEDLSKSIIVAAIIGGIVGASGSLRQIEVFKPLTPISTGVLEI
jgi:hypothetical protein